MATQIIEEPNEFSIWCTDEQNYTVFGAPKGEDAFLYIQQEGFGYYYSREQIEALHNWLGNLIEVSYESQDLTPQKEELPPMESAQELRKRIAGLERDLGIENPLFG